MSMTEYEKKCLYHGLKERLKGMAKKFFSYADLDLSLDIDIDILI